MRFEIALITAAVGLAAGQTLNIPTRVGDIVHLSKPSSISGSKDMGGKEFDRGRACDTDADTGSDSAVFILENGATLSNAIIGKDQLEGIHCKGACTIKNVWFRDVCEDAISALGSGNVLIEGGGAQEAKDKVVQHNGKGTVTIKNFTVVNAGKLYRSCGDCTNNEAKSPRKVVVENVRAFGMTSDLIGINSNFGDTATVSGSCGVTKNVCSEYKGVNKGSGSSSKLDTKDSCFGDQGKLAKLPECGAAPSNPTAAPATSAAPATTVKPVSSAKPTTLVTKTSAKTTTTKTSAAPTASATKESAGTVARYGQCGGNGYTGATACASGLTCKAQNEWYSQCL